MRRTAATILRSFAPSLLRSFAEMLRVIATVIAFVGTAFVSLGQPEPPYDPRIPVRCRPPEPSGCDAWTLIGKAYGIVVDRKIGKVETVEKKGRWITVDACNCFWGPCGSTQRRTCFPPANFAFSRQEQVCWKVGGSVSVEGKTGLVISLLGELGVTVAFNGEFSKCITTTTTLTFPIHQADCWHHKSRDVWTERTVQGKVIEAETVYYWECQRPNGWIVTVGTDCNRRESDGEASTIASIFVQNAPYPPCAGGPDPTPPEYEGQRAEQCCHPMSPCDVIPEGGHPCCGCYAPH